MTDRTIDITDRPKDWREGVTATGLYLGHWFTGEAWQGASGAWHVGSTFIWYSDGSRPAGITQLRVTRTVPALPEEEGTVVKWTDRYGYRRVAERFDGKWFRVGFLYRSTTEELLDLIGDAEVFVAEWRPLDARAGS